MIIYVLSNRLQNVCGEVSERFMELVLKTSDSMRAAGSNPALSAIVLMIVSQKFNSFSVTLPWRSTQVGDEAPLLRA